MNGKIAAIVVTYNKVKLLKECIKSLLSQSKKLDKIIIVNNNSNDGTKEYLDGVEKETNYKNFEIVNLDKNIGGAGGFNIGLKKAFELNMDYMWILDDDTIAEKDTLLKLYNVFLKEENVGFSCSNVRWIDNNPCLMNIPEFASSNYSLEIIDMIQLCKKATFVSMLTSRDVLKNVGYPIKDFFIWGDDSEFTTRISNQYNCFFVNNSLVVHKMNKNMHVNILEDSIERFPRYYYAQRNNVYRFRKMGFRYIIHFSLYTLNTCKKIVFSRTDNKLNKIKILLSGYLAGFTFNPKIEKPYKVQK